MGHVNFVMAVVLCQDAWRTFDKGDLGERSYGMKVTDAEIKHHWSSGAFRELKFLARHLGVSEGCGNSEISTLVGVSGWYPGPAANA